MTDRFGRGANEVLSESVKERPSTALKFESSNTGQGNVSSSVQGHGVHFLWLLIAADSREVDFKKEFSNYLA